MLGIRRGRVVNLTEVALGKRHGRIELGSVLLHAFLGLGLRQVGAHCRTDLERIGPREVGEPDQRPVGL
ncbi:hypothetical protein CQ042_07565 [Microbacterium sp. MYb62]|nr:hypothetical protein CQ042_07565 [Microbacterium sp. MYb62]